MIEKLPLRTPEEVRKQFETRLPRITASAHEAGSAGRFKSLLRQAYGLDEGRPLTGAERTIRCLLDHDGQTVQELSTGETITLNTITLLWHFLTGRPAPEEPSLDYLIDVFRQFERTIIPPVPRPDARKVMTGMARWPSALSPTVSEVQQRNKQRIIGNLVERIERRHTARSRYGFAPGMTAEEKRRQVEEWWDDYRFQITMAARSLRRLNELLGGTMSEEQIAIYRRAHEKGIPVFVTPYYLSLLDSTGTHYDDATLRQYIFYTRELVDAFGQIKAWEKEDRVVPGRPNAAGWLLPEGHNIHRRYPDVAILIPDTIGRTCGGLCASCQRLYDFQSGRFNFDIDSLRPKETWNEKLARLMDYFRNDAGLRDILITGGDALMSTNNSLRHILNAVCDMAEAKQRDNRQRPDGEKYAELQRVRLGTRLPVYLPMRVDEELVEILADFRRRAARIGVCQFFIQTHFQTPLEITPAACHAIERLQSAGWTVTNQLVFNATASRRGHTARLRRELNRIGVLCYYTFSVKGFEENHVASVPNCRSVQEQQEEKIIGRIDREGTQRLVDGLSTTPAPELVREIARSYDVPFIATDRNVMNLPGIGKSMTFVTAAIMPDGRRLLAFDHDHSRRHSPIVEKMPVVYIKENKSVAEYLRQLEAMGENPADYQSIWQYTEGQTEPRFPLYAYPDYPFRTTRRQTHLGLSDDADNSLEAG